MPRLAVSRVDLWVAFAVLHVLAACSGQAINSAHGDDSMVPGIPVIGLMAPDGSDPTFLIGAPGMKWNGSPTWAHDEKLIAFEANDGKFANGQLHVIAVRGPFKGSVRYLGLGGAPTWSPNDEQLAFHVREGNSEDQKPGIWVMNSDGSRRKWLSEGERPKWSPDGNSLVFAGKFEGFAALYQLDFTNEERSRLIDQKYQTIPGASWSPDGKRIAFIGYTEFGSRTGELVVMNIADRKTTVISRGRIGWHPNWSPDGRLIAFTMKDPEIAGADRVHVVDAGGGTEPKRLKNQEVGFRNVEAEWSPTGMQMVFSSDRWWPRK
jgi:Tol biopolymer transport system component